MKRSHGYVVEEPLRLPRDATIREAREFTRKHNVTGILIEETRGSNVLAGLLSNRDMPWTSRRRRPPRRRVHDAGRAAHDRRRRASSVDEAERLLFEHRIEKLPLVDAERRIRGLITKQDIILSRQRPYSSKDAKGRLLVGAAIGARGDFLERAAELLRAGADVLVIDIAHGHSDVMRTAVEAFRAPLRRRPSWCAATSARRRGRAFLRDLGVDAIKVGIGPGTRLPHAAGDRGRRAAAAGDPRGVVRGGRDGADHRRRRHQATTRTSSWRWSAARPR